MQDSFGHGWMQWRRWLWAGSSNGSVSDPCESQFFNLQAPMRQKPSQPCRVKCCGQHDRRCGSHVANSHLMHCLTNASTTHFCLNGPRN